MDDDHWIHVVASRRAFLTAMLRVVEDPLPFVELLASCPDEATARARLAQTYDLNDPHRDSTIDALLDLSFRRLVQSNRARIAEELASLDGESDAPPGTHLPEH